MRFFITCVLYLPVWNYPCTFFTALKLFVYFPCRCNWLQDAERRIRITHPPKHLIISLLRFSYDVKTQAKSKILQDIKYPRTLYLPLDECSSAIYGLYAVIIHSGTSSECGHYYCYARQNSHFDATEIQKLHSSAGKDVDVLNSQWYCFNDNRVTYSSYEVFGHISKHFPNDTAYILMYKRIDESVVGHNDEDSVFSETMAELIPRKLREAVAQDNATFLRVGWNENMVFGNRYLHMQILWLYFDTTENLRFVFLSSVVIQVWCSQPSLLINVYSWLLK